MNTFVDEIVEWGLKKPSIHQGVSQFMFIDSFIGYQKWEELDDLLKKIQVEKINTLSLLIFSRGTYSVRYNLKEWNNFINNVEIELTKRGENTKSLMWGLL